MCPVTCRNAAPGELTDARTAWVCNATLARHCAAWGLQAHARILSRVLRSHVDACGAALREEGVRRFGSGDRCGSVPVTFKTAGTARRRADADAEEDAEDADKAKVEKFFTYVSLPDCL